MLTVLTRCTNPPHYEGIPNYPPSSWRSPSGLSPRQLWTTATIPAYARPDALSTVSDMIPPATELQVVFVEEGWYNVTWFDRDGLKPVRWIKASEGVTTVPPQARTRLSPPVTAQSPGIPPPAPTTPRPSL